MSKEIEKDWMRGKEKVIILSAILLIIAIGFSYAWLKITESGENENTIRSGNLSLTLDDLTSNGILLDNAIPVSDKKGLSTAAYTFTLENDGTIDSEYTIYLDDLPLDTKESRMQDNYIKYSLTKNEGSPITDLLTTTGENPNRILDRGRISPGTTNSYTLRLWINSAADNGVMGTIFYGKLRAEATQIKKNENNNQNNSIIESYTYNQAPGTSDYCITGEEPTCKTTSCYKSKTANSCVAGTIMKIKVNNEMVRYFYVLHDDGENITLQQRENTVYNTAWYGTGDDNTQGPLTILSALDEATKNWDNVQAQKYTMGATNFNGTNSYTSCSAYNVCDSNTYTLGEKTVKARMITLQEAAAVGCTGANHSCPIWMSNYLHESTSNGGTINDVHIENGSESNAGYWTMQSYSPNSTNAWRILQTGRLVNFATTNAYCGARAVITISK